MVSQRDLLDALLRRPHLENGDLHDVLGHRIRLLDLPQPERRALFSALTTDSASISPLEVLWFLGLLPADLFLGEKLPGGCVVEL